MRPITEVAADLGLQSEDLEIYGSYKAKVSISAMNRFLAPSTTERGKLILVTAMTPTKAGEGKTTVCIGLAEALSRTGVKAVCAIREPSLGPVFGVKGGATGGGLAQVVPTEDINLHFTGDMHAVTSANNLLAALVDNHLFHGNALQLDSRSVCFRRAVDMSDRALRSIVTGLGGRNNGFPMETGFNITAASEVMAILCLADSVEDLEERLGRIVVAQSISGEPICARDLKAQGAMTLLLKDAVKPNLVQTTEGTPAFVHGGPFANIAHGSSSVLATKLALKLSDYVVTEAGFGADLGLEKFCNIVAAPRAPDLTPDAVVLVVTARALKLHGGLSPESLSKPDVVAVERGMPNLVRHAEIITSFGLPFSIAINRFSHDSNEEIEAIKSYCRAHDWRVSACDVFKSGGEGGVKMAEAVRDTCRLPNHFRSLYNCEKHSLEEKIRLIVCTIYGATSVEFSTEAIKQMSWLAKHGYQSLPVCVAKTQYSLSDDPLLLGAPANFTMKLHSLRLSAGAGFVVAVMGDIMTMPGLPAHPRAQDMGINRATK